MANQDMANQGMAGQDAASTKPLPGGNTVLVEIENRIAWVTMNRPEKRNAINPTLSFEMLDVFEALETDDRCGVLVLSGAGEAYSAGMDLKEYFRATDKMNYDQRLQIMRKSALAQWKRLQFYGKPTIAMVNGWCFGGGFNSMIACDLAIAAEDAKFGLSEINWGIIPAGGVTKAVASVIGQRDTMYYIMTGEPFDGRRAAAMGLVNEAVPRAQLRERTRALATTLLEKNPMALRMAKHAARRVRDMSWEDAEDYLFAKIDQLRFNDPEKGREKGMQQFLDDKSFRPGLAAYRRET
jgi:trans-feruloyl-CoA hydratase/vanillin synthase